MVTGTAAKTSGKQREDVWIREFHYGKSGGANRSKEGEGPW